MLRERFSRGLDAAALRLSESTSEDRALLGADLWGSIAHARMLGDAGILPKPSANRILRGLRSIARLAASGRYRLDPVHEDVHLNIERTLTRRIGKDGERLHTGRSRNDQVATDLAVYEREALLALELRLERVVGSLVVAARRPSAFRTVDGWTHMQPAQRLYWAGILGAHALRFARDLERLARVRASVRLSPLGSGALAGSSLPLDRRLTARLLGFDAPHPSSIDAVSDRDGAIETAFALALAQLHASQLAEELIIGSMGEVGRVRFGDAFVTTSSLMPHKRNPDLAELVRAESAGALGRLMAHLALVRSLPLGYQRDLQAGKPLLVESVRRAALTFDVLAPMIASAEFLSPKASGAATASVELVDELVRAGVPFRRAHVRVGAFVDRAERSQRSLASFSARELRSAFPEIPRKFRLPGPDEEPERRTVEGGSSRRSVERLLTEVEGRRRRAAAASVRELRRLRRLRRACGLPEQLFEIAPAPRGGH
ncbi:MAG: argininosuccinate lyase [Thermoplasmata archaeon]|nr:argininosuccinate lyase [Thermoplasmata archaeon]